MAALPESQHTTAAAIVRWYENKPQEHRPHLGASILGHACQRYIWLTWRWALTPTFPGRILRLFDTGRREEPRLIEELRGIGAEVWDVDPATGGQWRVTFANGHGGGSLDGVAQGVPEAPKTPCVLEFKTHSSKSFADLVAKRVQASKPQHYDQMQCYMGLMELDRALYMAVNKDNDDVYCEWVHFERARFDELMAKAEALVAMTTPPARLSEDPSNWQCKGCTFWKLCHGGKAAEANCRTCCNATPIDDGAWRCEKNPDLQLTHGQQLHGCGEHLLIPALVPYGEPVDGADGYIVYKHRDSGAHFVNGPEGCNDLGPQFSSKELHHCPGELIGDMSAFKDHFPGAKVVKPEKLSLIDMPSDDLDAVPTKPESAAKKASRIRNKAFLQAMDQMEGGPK